MGKELLLDMGWGIFVVYYGFISLAIIVPVTIVAETAIIKLVLKLPIGQALRDSIVMNLVSGFLGFGAIVILGPILGTQTYFGETYYSEPPQEVVQFAFLRVMGLFCAISIVVEGFILGVMEGNCPRRLVWLIAIVSNLVSYSVMLLLVVWYASRNNLF